MVESPYRYCYMTMQFESCSVYIQLNDINTPNLNHTINNINNTSADGQLTAVDDNKVTSAVVTVTESVNEAISNNTPGGIRLDVPLHIGEVFKRPVQYYTVPLSTLTPGALDTTPCEAFLGFADIVAKCRNFNLIRGDFHIRASVISSAYAYGRIIASIVTPQVRALSTPPPAAKAYVQAKSRDHVVLDIGMSTTAEIKIPWTNAVNYWQMIPVDYSTSVDFPHLELCLEGPLLDVSTGAAPSGNLTLYVWMENVEMGVPVPFLYTSEKVKASKDGFISTPLSTISKATHMLSSVPIIGKFAESISIASGAGSRIAALFGFSKPVELGITTNVGFIPLSNAIGADQARTLTLDPNQQITVDPQLSASTTDVLSYKNIIGRFAPVAYVDYTTATATDSILAFFPVHPGMVVGSATDTAVMMTPLAFGAITHDYWRGTIVYKINFIASKYHRGRVRIFWSPTNTIATSVNNSSYNTIVDITSSTTVTVNVTWQDQYPYLQTGLCHITSGNNGNGFLFIQALAPLISPSTACPVHISIDEAAGDDFELIRPTTQYIQNLSLYPYNAPTVDFSTVESAIRFAGGVTAGTRTISQVAPSGAGPILYQSLQSPSDTNVAVHSTVSTSFGSSVYQPVNQTYMGEQFNTFRAACKRFTTGYIFGGTSVVGSTPLRFIPWAPPFPGTISNGAGGYFRAPTAWTFPSWFVLPFRGARGSMRAVLVNDLVTVYTATPKVRAYFSYEKKYSYSLMSSPQTITNSLANELSVAQQMGSGSEYFDGPVGQAVTIVIPYQHFGNYLQTPWPGQSGSGNYEPGVVVQQWGTSPSPAEVLYAAGEDWSPVAWVQIPYMYLAVSNPVGTTSAFTVDAPDDESGFPPDELRPLEEPSPDFTPPSASTVTSERLLSSAGKRYKQSYY